MYTDFAESWSDTSSGGGTFVFADPTASAVHFGHTNQTALGGSRGTDIGAIQSVITTNAVNAITAGGSAVGNVIGAAVKAPSGGTSNNQHPVGAFDARVDGGGLRMDLFAGALMARGRQVTRTILKL